MSFSFAPIQRNLLSIHCFQDECITSQSKFKINVNRATFKWKYSDTYLKMRKQTVLQKSVFWNTDNAQTSILFPKQYSGDAFSSHIILDRNWPSAFTIPLLFNTHFVSLTSQQASTRPGTWTRPSGRLLEVPQTCWQGKVATALLTSIPSLPPYRGTSKKKVPVEPEVPPAGPTSHFFLPARRPSIESMF